MPTVAQLQGEISLNADPFISELKHARAEWEYFQQRTQELNSKWISHSAQAQSAVTASFASIGTAIKNSASEMMAFGAVVTASFGGAIAFATKAASDLSESMNAAEAVFKESAGTVKEFASTSATSFGISRQAALEATASFGGMFTAMGLGRKASADLSIGVIALAADLVSLRNIQGGLAEGLEKVRSGLIGESEPLRRIGILVDDATIKHKAFEVGLKNAGGELSQQQKVLLRYLEILDQSKDAMGDFQRTSTGMANSSRILSAQFEDLAAKLGERFATASNTAFGIAVQLMGVLNNLPTSIMGAAAAFLAAGAAIGTATLAIGTIVAILGGPLTLALTGIVAVVGAVAIGISQNWEAIVEMTKGMGINVGGSLRTVVVAVGYLVDVISAGTRLILLTFDSLITGARIMANGVVAAFNYLKGSIVNVISAIVSGDMVGLATALSTGFSGAMQTVGAGVSAELKALGERGGKALGDMSAFLGGRTAKAFGDAFDKGIAQAKAFDYSKLRQQILDQLKNLTGEIDKEGKKAGKGAGDAAAKAASKAALDSVNEMLKTLKAGVEISKSYWDRMSGDQKASLTAQSFIIRKFNDELKDIMLDRVLSEKQTIEVSLSQWRRLSEGIKKAMHDAGVAIKIAFPKVAIDGTAVAEGAAIVSKQFEELYGKGITLGLKNAVDAAKGTWKFLPASLWELPIPLNPEKFGLGIAMKEALAQLRDDIKSSLGDGIGSVVVSLADKLRLNLQNVKGWAKDVGEVIETMPGKWGKVARDIFATLDQWIRFANGVLSVLNRVFGEGVPSSLNGVVDAIIGIFKSDKSTTGVGSAISGLVSSATQSATGAATAAGQAAGGAVTGGISGGISAGIPAVTNAMTGIFSAITGAVSVFAQTFQSDSKAVRFAGGALLGGPIGGILSMIFGGPSEFEKQKRQLQLDKMKADIASVYEDIKSSMVDVMSKGLALLEGIANSNVIDMPLKAIKRFINKLTLILELWLDSAQKFKGEALAKGKEVAESLGGGIDVMLSGAQLITAIRELGSVTDAKIKEFVDTTLSILQKWIDAVSEIEIKSAKFANKVSTKLASSVELISKFPELIRSIIDAAKITVTDAQLSLPFETAKRIMGKFFVLAEEFQGYALNKTAKVADQFTRIFESAKSIFDALTNISTYRPVGETIFDLLAADISYILKKMIDIAQTVDRELLDTAAEISASIQGVLGTVKAAYDGFAALGTYKSIAADSFDALAVDIRLAVNKMGEIAAQIGVEAAESAGKFAESAGKVVGIIKEAVEAFNALDDLQNVEVGPFNALEIYIRRSIEIMARISGSITDALMEQVAVFANKTRSVFDALKSAVSVFTDLSNLSGGRDVAGSNFPDISAAFDGLMSFTERAVTTIGELARSAASEMVDDALLFATKAKVIFESITAGASSIKAIGELKDAPFAALSAFTTGFADAMTKMSELVAASISFEGLTGDFRDHIQDAVRNLREGVSALGAVLTGTQGFGGQNLTLQAANIGGGNFASSSSGLGSLSSSSGGLGAAGSQTLIVNVYAQGHIFHDAQIPDLVMKGVVGLQQQKRIKVITG